MAQQSLAVRDASGTTIRYKAITPLLDGSGAAVTDVNGLAIYKDVTSDPDASAALGAPTDLAWDLVESVATLVSLLKSVAKGTNGPLAEGTSTIGAVTQAGGTWATADENGAAFGGVVAIVFGETFAAGRSIGFICTVSGNLDLLFADGTSWSNYPIQAAAGVVQTLPYALTKVSLSASSTAAVSLWNLK